ncbi:MAG: hypothetical protein QOG53_1317 [Frankiales bacterium]|nr:hypothetical protein [Frankiales bacterium]
MSRYLIVTHQTARSPELQQKISELIAKDAAAEFSILMPEQERTDSWEGGDTLDVAQQRLELAQEELQKNTGASVVRTAVGSSDPLKAIEQELVGHKDYSTILICTLPRGASRWLKRDLIGNAQKKFGLPVIHVVAEGASR